MMPLKIPENTGKKERFTLGQVAIDCAANAEKNARYLHEGTNQRYPMKDFISGSGHGRKRG